MKRTKRTLVILGLALASCRGPVLSPTATPYTVSVPFVATTATYSLVQDVVAAYQPAGMLLVAETAVVNCDAALHLVQARTAPYALTAYLPPDSGLWAAPLGWDGIAIVVHVLAPIPALRLEDLRLLFQGRVESWAALGGDDLPVTVVSRETGADTRLAFEALVMGDRAVTPAARLALSSAGVIDIVASVPGAIGYVSRAYVDERVATVPLIVPGEPEPVFPSAQAVRSGRYPLRSLIVVTGLEAPAPGTVYYDWFAWMQSQAGQAVIARRYAPLE